MKTAAEITARTRTTARLGRLFPLAVLGLLLWGCMSLEQSSVADVNPHTWVNPASVTLHNEDTLSLHDLHLFIRTNDRFTGDSLPLQITLLTPDSMRFQEHFILTIPTGHSPASLGRETSAVYRREVRFARMGEYRLIISPVAPAQGVEAVGIYQTKSE